MPEGAHRGWVTASGAPQSLRGGLDLWLADLTSVGAGIGELLSDEELTRARRFASEADGRLWARAHGLLRRLIGDYLGMEPRSLAFASGPHGKPALDGPPAGLHFNISHSGALALYAFTRDGEVGVDIEVAPAERDILAVARRAFGPERASELAALEPAARRERFLREWVRHEAVLKFHGVGIGGAGAMRASEDLWTAELAVGAEAAAAVTLASEPRALRMWAWPGSPGVGQTA